MPAETSMTLLTDPNFLALDFGAVVGLILALSGAGGGIIAVPLLVFGLKLPMQQAAPIGLMAVGLAATLGAAFGLRRGIVRYRAATLIGVAGMLMAPLGVWLAQRIPNRPLMFFFALILAWTGYRMLRRSLRQSDGSAPEQTGQPCRLNTGTARFDWTLPCARALGATGLASGLLSGLLGVGGGFVIVPAITRYSNLPPASVVATSLAVIALVSAGGIAAAAMTGHIVWGIALPFVGGAVAGLLLGRALASRLAGRRMQQSFALLSLAVAVIFGLRALGLSLS